MLVIFFFNRMFKVKDYSQYLFKGINLQRLNCLQGLWDYVIVNDFVGIENVIVMNKVFFVEINYGIINLIF